jgi:hypothetical protein
MTLMLQIAGGIILAGYAQLAINTTLLKIAAGINAIDTIESPIWRLVLLLPFAALGGLGFYFLIYKHSPGAGTYWVHVLSQ